ncbi:hypothetical protein OHV10_18760 [Vibrio splendidus]|uniref:Cap15 family cyclic dinucleotide receptor domain-containing protein n=1 Tax=Vibrio splendidus TaxID=29497 RepID=UPI00223543A3|nr:hypothetical protein [Vibrio splendidus]MCW4446287.1 hypothetical protein [Vibrio splendidus]
MWKIFPKFSLAKILMTSICFLVATVMVWLTDGWSGVASFYNENGFDIVSRLTLPVIVIFIVTTWLLGAVLWRFVWRFPYLGTELLNTKVCPDLNGTWVGKTISTYLHENGNPYEKEVQLKIKANFFKFEISLVSLDNYQRSTVVQSEIYKDHRDGSFYLSYIFESVVDQPVESDDSKFDGSAKLHVRFEDSGIKLVGVYWTNRCWQKGGQTAGSITLNRV